MKPFSFRTSQWARLIATALLVLLFYQNCANQFQAINGLNMQNYSSLQAKQVISALETRSSVGYKSSNRASDFVQDPLFTDRMTLFLAGPAENELVHDELFVFDSGGAENDQIVVAFSEDRKNLLIYRKSDPANYLTYQIPLGENFERFVIAIDFKQKPGMEKIMFNGHVLNANATTTGLLSDFSYLIKEVTQDQSVLSMLVVEDLTLYEMNMISSLMAQQAGVMNFKIDFSLSNSEVIYAPNEIETRALSLIRTRCASCHEQHGSWAGYTTNNFISQGMISAGSPSDSKIYQRITTSDSTKKMPPVGSLGADDPQLIREWILNIK